jgi:hypothetical protein
VTFFQFFEAIDSFLRIQNNNIVVMASYAGLHALAALLRVITHLGYRAQSVLFALDIKDIKSKDDAKKVRSPLLRRVIGDYIKSAEKNPARVPLEALADRHIQSLSFLGWRYAGMRVLVEKLEGGLPLCGVALALAFPGYAPIYGLLTVAGFALTRLVAAFFDYSSACEILRSDVMVFAEREIGVFFAGATATAITKLKEELAASAETQSAALREAVDRLNADMGASLKNLERLSLIADLGKAVEAVNDGNALYRADHEAFMRQAHLIETGQTALDNALQSYETTLQGLVKTMGDGMGAYMQLHGQAAARSVGEALQSYITRVSDGNRETLQAITALLEQFNAQNRDVQTHLRALHERIEEN